MEENCEKSPPVWKKTKEVGQYVIKNIYFTYFPPKNADENSEKPK